MFQIVRLELNHEGKISECWPLQPPYELWEDAMALAEFDASRCDGDFGYDDAHQCWWACDAHGRRYRFVIEQFAPEPAQISRSNAVPCGHAPVMNSTEFCSTQAPADQHAANRQEVRQERAAAD
jgi:hypothetical protein